MPKEKKVTERLLRQVKWLTYQLKNEKRLGSYTNAAKTAISVFNGSLKEDCYHKVFSIGPFGPQGQYFAVLDNTAIIGVTGVVQPGFPRVITNVCFRGTAFVKFPHVPLENVNDIITAEQFQFTWCLILVRNGQNPNEVLDNMNPPLYVPSQPALLTKVIQEVNLPNGVVEYEEAAATLQQDAMDWQGTVTVKRKRADDTEDDNSQAKFGKPTPTPSLVDADNAETAQVTVAELITPRQMVLMCGTGVTSWNSTSIANYKIEAYNGQKIKVKTDDQILFMAKAADNQNVCITGTISYESIF